MKKALSPVHDHACSRDEGLLRGATPIGIQTHEQLFLRKTKNSFVMLGTKEYFRGATQMG